MIKKIYVIYNFICGVLIALALIDRYAGKILKILDPTFRNLLNSKLPKTDKATAKEQIIHVLKKSSNDGIIQTKEN